MFPPPPHVARRIAKDIEGIFEGIADGELRTLFPPEFGWMLLMLFVCFVGSIFWEWVTTTPFGYWLSEWGAWFGYVVFNSKDYWKGY